MVRLYTVFLLIVALHPGMAHGAERARFAEVGNLRSMALQRDGDPAANRPAHLTVFKFLGEERGLRLVHECALRNKYRPSVSMLSPNGRFFVTLNEYLRDSSGPNTVVIYDLERHEHSAYGITDFLDKKTIDSLDDRASHHWWHGIAPVFNLSSTKAYLTSPTEAHEEGFPFVVIDLPSRSVVVQPVTEVVDLEHIPAMMPLGWKPSRQIIETDTGALPAHVTLIRLVGLPRLVFDLDSTKTRYLPRQSQSSPLISNSIGMQFAPIPAGKFMMGSPAGEEGADDDERLHQVTISREFYLGVHEVTQRQYRIITRLRPSQFRKRALGANSGMHPVESLSWEDAVEFCRKLSALEAERSAGRSYRLPTEAEWEYACRAGSQHAFSFGDAVRSLDEYAWHTENSDGQTHPVGAKKPNAWGLYDMHGNVWEWCSDWYGDYPDRTVTDPSGPELDGQISGRSAPWPDQEPARVTRGGSWDDSRHDCRSANRGASLPDSRGSAEQGFRVVLVLEATDEE